MSCGLLPPKRARLPRPELEDLLDLQHVQEKALAPPTGDEMQDRLRQLRSRVTEAKIDWLLVPYQDAHQSELLNPADERLLWVSNCKSPAVALIPSNQMEQDAIFFTGDMFWIEADASVPKNGWEVVRVQGSLSSLPSAWTAWLRQHADDGFRVGVDPRLITASVAGSIQDDLEPIGATLVALEHNPIDQVASLPPAPLNPIVPYPESLAGESVPSKLARTRDMLGGRLSSDILSSAAPSYAYILSIPNAIAWLLNIRCPGCDSPFTPSAFMYLILTPDRCAVFVDEQKIQDEELRNLWQSLEIEVQPYEAEAIGKWVKEYEEAIKKVDEKRQLRVLATDQIGWDVVRRCEPLRVTIISDPVSQLQAIKNEQEQLGMRNAYLRDGRAMVRWLSWLEPKVKGDRPLGEWAAGQALLRLRAQEEMNRGEAYPFISASGPNGASPHYFPIRGADSVIAVDAPYVIDSGGQYLDGTIDTTRTLFFGGNPSADIKRAYTRVLQAHMAVATLVFPSSAAGAQILGISKQWLYKDGLDLGHGITHGVGSYLGVHEATSLTANSSFKRGNIITVEPGFYVEREYGIRIESVFIVVAAETQYQFGGDVWHKLERITQVPIATNLIDWSLMSKDDIRWVNEHNASVEQSLTPLLQEERDKEALDWLKKACKPRRIWPWTGA